MASPEISGDHDRFTPALAVQFAALMWAVMLILLLAVFLFAFSMTMPAMQFYTSPTRSDTFVPVLVLAGALLVIAGFAHWYLFRAYWEDGLVQPKGWLLASIILYSGVTLSAVLALLGMVIDGSMFPNILVAAMVVLLLLAIWPSGRAMRVPRPRGEEDDDVELFHLGPEDEQRDR